MSDQNLRKLVEAELDWDPCLDASRIGVAVDQSVVTLSGAAASYAEKMAAERAAQSVKGVLGVAQNIEVRPFGDVGVDDDEIAKRAVRTLEWDVMVPNERIKIRVEDGHVTLTGEVDWKYQRDASERAVRNLYGVRAFNNQIKLKARVQPSDVHRRIEDALDRQAQIDGRNIQVKVEGGRVSLEGKVNAWADRAVIERAAWGAHGVTAVEDRVTIAA